VVRVTRLRPSGTDGWAAGWLAGERRRRAQCAPMPKRPWATITRNVRMRSTWPPAGGDPGEVV
jgi:hypothetical protein